MEPIRSCGMAIVKNRPRIGGSEIGQVSEHTHAHLAITNENAPRRIILLPCLTPNKTSACHCCERWFLLQQRVCQHYHDHPLVVLMMMVPMPARCGGTWVLQVLMSIHWRGHDQPKASGTSLRLAASFNCLILGMWKWSQCRHLRPSGSGSFQCFVQFLALTNSSFEGCHLPFEICCLSVWTEGTRTMIS